MMTSERSWWRGCTTLGVLALCPALAHADSLAGVTTSSAATQGQPSGPAIEASSAADESSATAEVASFASIPLKDSPAVVTVISGEDIKAVGARDLIDILYLVPGYFFGLDTEGVVGPGFRGLWGHEGKILLLIDGKEMNELLFSNMQLGNEFPVELIERVEVVRGPGSVIYGGNAELSVINVVTRGLQGSTDLMATATYGEMTGAHRFSNGYARRKITLSGRLVVDQIPGLSSFVSVSLGQGQRSVRDFVDATGVAATMEGQSDLNPTVVQAGVGYRDVQASLLYQHLGESSISGAGLTRMSPLSISFDSFHAELVGTFRPTARIEIVPRFNFTYQRPWHAANLDADFYDKSVRRLRARLLGRWAALDQLQVTVGGDAMFDQGRLDYPANDMYPNQLQFGTSNSINYQTLGSFVELYSENPIVNVAAGARYDHLSTVGGALVPRLVLLRNFGPVSLKGLFSLSFRAPSIENINQSVGLRSEHTRVFEFEGAVDLPAQQRLSANVFDVSIDAPIAFTRDPITGDGYANLGRQGTRGVEVSYRLGGPLARVEANYSFYAPSISENINPYIVPGHSEQFLAAPAHRGSVHATIRPWGWLGVSPSAIILGPRFARGIPDSMGGETANPIPAQVLANLFVYRDNVGIRGLTVGIGAYNILGTNFRYIHASAPLPDDPAPLPGLDREVMLRLAYMVEPTDRDKVGAK